MKNERLDEEQYSLISNTCENDVDRWEWVSI